MTLGPLHPIQTQNETQLHMAVVLYSNTLSDIKLWLNLNKLMSNRLKTIISQSEHDKFKLIYNL